MDSFNVIRNGPYTLGRYLPSTPLATIELLLTSCFPVDIVIVSGSSSNHYAESLDGLSSIHEYLPEAKIIYYNLGLSIAERRVSSY